MQDIVYIQKEKNGDQFIGDFAYCAFEGFRNKGYKIITFEEIEEVPKGKDFVMSNITDTIAYWNRLGVKIPGAMNVFDLIPDMVYRKYQYMTLGEFFSKDLCPVFIKPAYDTKAFVSGVIRNDSSKRFVLSDAKEETVALVTDCVSYLTEYRCFINRGKIVGLKHYQGDFMSFIDVSYANMCLDKMNALEGIPISYTLDFGLRDDGRTEVIEANDGWSVGTYGLDGEVYSRFVFDRWMEIINGKNVNFSEKYKNKL